MKKLIMLVTVGLALNSCSKTKDKVDTIYPTIDISAANAFPQQCSIIQKGQSITVRFTANDNVELGSASIDIHQNFDHHNHSTEINTSTLDPVKTPVKPFMLMKTFLIPAGKTMHVVEEQISVPADVDAGDYHFMLKVTDKSGWQTLKGLSVKIQ